MPGMPGAGGGGGTADIPDDKENTDIELPETVPDHLQVVRVLPHEVDEVVGERVVVIDDQNHRSGSVEG
jgi:D-ribose pyranose/furanose isomerase RbsD